MMTSKALVTSALLGFREHQEAVTEFKKHKATENEFLRDLILNENRIDLLMTEVLGYEIKDFHEVMFDAAENNSFVIANTLDKRQVWNLTLAPRGFGKSTCLNIARCILKILQNPNIRILIASKTDTNAVSFLSEIKQKLLRPKMVEVFGVQQSSPWNDGSIRVKARASDAKEDTIETIGIGGAIASKHYDMIVADDLIDESNSISATTVTRARNFGQIDLMEEADITTVVWSSVEDERTSEICLLMNGRIFTLDLVKAQQNRILEQTSADAVKELYPWRKDLSEFKIGRGERLSSHETSKLLAESGVPIVPPAHFRCRSELIPG